VNDNIKATKDIYEEIEELKEELGIPITLLLLTVIITFSLIFFKNPMLTFIISLISICVIVIFSPRSWWINETEDAKSTMKKVHSIFPFIEIVDTNDKKRLAEIDAESKRDEEEWYRKTRGSPF
jgi:hypothetical protein